MEKIVYNKAKKILGRIAGILSIVNGALCAILTILVLSGVDLLGGGYIVMALFFAAFAALLILFGIKAVKTPRLENDEWNPGKKEWIAQIVVNAALFVFTIVAMIFLMFAVGIAAGQELEDAAALAAVALLYDYFLMVLAIPPVPLSIVTLCLKAERKEEPAPETTSAPEIGAPLSESVPEQLTRLKAWLDEGIITKEQYDSAVEKLLRNYL